MKKDKRIRVRIDEHTDMILQELVTQTGACMSVLVRSFIRRVIDEITDEQGNLIWQEEKTKRRKPWPNE